MAICTAEQKIAYNLAFAWGECLSKAYKKAPTRLQKSDAVREGVLQCVAQWRRDYSTNSRFDIDSIFCALSAGLENYLQKGCPILWSYAEIGAMFPALYLNE